ncbi:MAG: glucose-1-phosphate cytidylyltransferase [Bacteroidetes bacterium]|nr:MAG: glucose-1-phosphate cytidylyltransferase [Bacteroidota bacterium]
MKVVIFAGGMGTRISEESHLKPKPMIEIGGKPIIWHIMKHYAFYGHNEFVICLGYKGHMIREYFMNYFLVNSDITIDTKTNKMEVLISKSDEFSVTLVETGLETMTAGRLKQVQKYVDKEDFMLTYGDGVSDVNLDDLVKGHQAHGKIATMTVIQPNSRFGIVEMDENNLITNFVEKPKESGSWINGGFFVLKPEVFKHLKDDADEVMWERQPLNDLASDRQIVVHKHSGFWKCMDTMRDKEELDSLWEDNPAWKCW